MKYLTILILIVSFPSYSYTQNKSDQKNKSKVKQIDDSYKSSHTFEGAPRPLVFSRNTPTRSWVYSNMDWKLAKVDINSFSEINDSILINADFDAMFEELDKNGKPMKNLNIGIGNFVIAKHKSRVNDYYVFNLIDQIREKVKIEYKSYRVRSKAFSEISDLDKLRYCILHSDLRTLEELVTQEGVDINVCEKLVNIEITPLSLAISKGKRAVFDKLIELGADIDQPCRGNRTALMRASGKNDSYYFKKLIELGADISVKDEKGRTVHDYVKNDGQFDLLELLGK